MNLNTYNFDGTAIVTLVPRGITTLIEGDIVGFFIINNTLKFYGTGTELLFSCHVRNLEKYFELLTIYEDLEEVEVYETEDIDDKELSIQLLNNAIDKALDNGDKELFQMLASKLKDIE